MILICACWQIKHDIINILIDRCVDKDRHTRKFACFAVYFITNLIGKHKNLFAICDSFEFEDTLQFVLLYKGSCL
jgi:hypothetical protein